MAKIIDFMSARRKPDPETMDFDNLLRHASLIFQERVEKIRESHLSEVRTVKVFFENKITSEILKRNLVGRDTLMCGIYISNLLDELASHSPESWWAIDYLNSEDAQSGKKGGDVCFLIYGVFPARGNYRAMKLEYYRKMGVSFYSKFYGLKKKEIGYYMSRQFETMAGLTRNILSELKNTSMS